MQSDLYLFYVIDVLPLHPVDILLIDRSARQTEHSGARSSDLHRQPHEPVRGRSRHLDHHPQTSGVSSGGKKHAEAAYW